MASSRVRWAVAFGVIVAFATLRAGWLSNPTVISIPSGPDVATPYPSSIVVSGVTGTVKRVKVTLANYTHTFPNDVGIVLVAPGGQALLLMDGVGDEADAAGATITFADGAPALPNLAAPTSGTYKPTAHIIGHSFPSPGPLAAYSNPGPAGGGAATFASTFGGTNPNGTWSLFVADFAGGNSGVVAGGWSLTIVSNAPIDFNGNATTDFTVVRIVGGGTSVAWYWWTGTLGGELWGITSDRFVPADFDGDAITDAAVWRSGTPGTWYIHRSTDHGVTTLPFGAPGDNPGVRGDYDGDGKADQAVYRAGTTIGAPSFWYVWRSATSTLLGVQWGQYNDRAAPGDYDGDGKLDFVVMRPGAQATFYLLLSGGGTSAIPWGLSTDVIVPGDYDGDGRTDVAIARGAAGTIQWHIRRSSDGGYTSFTFGATASDSLTPGDYDGDGATDVSVWRPHANPALTAFYVRWSSDGSFHAMQFGQQGDYPMANTNVH